MNSESANRPWKRASSLCLPCVILAFVPVDSHAEMIVPRVHEVSSEHAASGRLAVNTVNSSLFADGKHVVGHITRGPTDVAGQEEGLWMTNGINEPKDLKPFIIYDLGAVMDVSTIHVWNFNSGFPLSLNAEEQKTAERSTWNRPFSIIGADLVEISTSSDGVTYEPRGSVRFEMATTKDDYPGQVIPVDYEQVRYVRFDIKTSHEGAVFDGTGTKNGSYEGRACTGLAEVRFGGPSAIEVRIDGGGETVKVGEGAAEPSAYAVRLRKPPQEGQQLTLRVIPEDPIFTLGERQEPGFVDLTFTKENWDSWQEVKVRALDDDVATVGYVGKIHHLMAPGIDPTFGRSSALDVLARLEDNDKEKVAELEPIDPAKRMEWFQDMKYYWFIHWNPSSLSGFEISFARALGQVPKDEYDQLYRKFNPTEFDADEWVRIAKAAGLKTIVFVTKHHDGFCMWDTKTTDYNIMNTPFGRDVTKELSEACKRHGMRFSLYYSIMDWWHPDYTFSNASPAYALPGGEKPSTKRFVEYMDAQVKELLTNYGDVSLMWWDGGYGMPGSGAWPTPDPEWSVEVQQAFDKRVRELQPAMVQNNRVGVHIHHVADGIGDYPSSEFGLGGYNWGAPWEYTFTLGTQWSWKPDDIYKSKRYMIQTLMGTAARGGNALMDVSPGPTGAFEPRVVERLTEIGNWLKLYGESYYGTRGGPYMAPSGSWGVSTRKGNRIYLHIFNWPAEGKLTLPALGLKVAGSRVLTGGSVEVGQADASSPLTIDVPPHYRREINTVVELEMEANAMAIPPIQTP